MNNCKGAMSVIYDDKSNRNVRQIIASGNTYRGSSGALYHVPDTSLVLFPGSGEAVEFDDIRVEKGRE